MSQAQVMMTFKSVSGLLSGSMVTCNPGSDRPQALCTISPPLLQLQCLASSLHGLGWKMASSLLISNSPWTLSILTGRTQEMLLDLGNEENHSVGSTAITNHLKAVGFACLLITTSIPQTVPTYIRLQLNFCSSHQSNGYC